MESPTLTIKQGKLRGVVDTDIDGNKILKFLDIPYAKPPTGELRFRAPLPAVPWNGILDASKNSRRCFGETFWPDGEVPPMEDALLLNVYTREVLVDNSRRRPFGPVIEKPNPSAFLIQEPIEIFRSGRFNHVPTMIGTCSNEGFVYEFILKLKNIKLDPHEFGIPWSLGLKKESQDWKQVGESLSHFYYKDGVTSDALAELCGDASFLYGVFESARLQLQTSKSAVYPYIFNYECPLAQRLFLLFSEGPIKGVSHGGESTFLFSVLQNTAELQNEDKEAIRMIVKIWTSFAKTGIPHECWKPAEVRQFKYFYIDKESELREGFPFPERLQIWKKIIKKFGQMTFEANVND